MCSWICSGVRFMAAGPWGSGFDSVIGVRVGRLSAPEVRLRVIGHRWTHVVGTAGRGSRIRGGGPVRTAGAPLRVCVSEGRLKPRALVVEGPSRTLHGVSDPPAGDAAP